MINSRILSVLRILVECLKSEDICWTVTASCSVALQGVDVNPNDIDILSDKHGAIRIGVLLKKHEVKPVSFSRTDTFESYFGTYDIEGTKVEVMGDLRVKLDDTWIPMSYRLKSIIHVQIDSLNIPVISLYDELLFYEKLGREKDKVNILKIREKLN